MRGEWETWVHKETKVQVILEEIAPLEFRRVSRKNENIHGAYANMPRYYFPLWISS